MHAKSKYISLRLGFIATFFTIAIFVFLFIFLGIKHRKYAYDDSKQIASEISKNAVNETEMYLNNALQVARNLKEKSILLKDYYPNREIINGLLKTELIKNPTFIATWTMWEHNAFDGKDNQYKNKGIYDSSGNLSVTYFKYNDTILTEQVGPEDYFEDFYTIPKETKSELIIEPYIYQYAGFPYIFYEISVVVPIIIDTSFIGIFAIDLNMEYLQKKLNNIKLYKTGYLSLITNSGNIVSHPDTTFVNKNFFTLVSQEDSLVQKTIIQGKEATNETISEFTGKRVFRYFYPIKASGSTQPWSIMVEIPVKEATLRARQLSIIAIGTLITGLILLVYLILNLFDRLNHEKELIDAKHKAEQANNLKTAFLNNISHEIRTPLNGILGFTELITKNNISDEQRTFYKDIIKNSGEQLISTITNVIELSKIQSGQVEKTIREFNVQDAISCVVETYVTAAKEKGLQLITNIPEENRQLLIFSDQNKFKQILSYLLNNAIKFTNEGFVEVGLKTTNGSITAYVKDTGIGIDQKNFANIFNYFTQEDQSSTRNYGGLGAGLTIAKSFTELLNGTISFGSEQGKGTTFTITLPVKSEVISEKNNN